MNKLPILVISDIHGNNENLSKVLNNASYNTIICCGDMEIDNDISNTITLSKTPFYYVKGNCDSYFNYGNFGLTDARSYLCINVEDKEYFVTHGHLDINIPNNVDFILLGHTHLPTIYKIKNQIIINPGSISRGRSSLGNTYSIIYSDKAQLYQVETNKVLMTFNFVDSYHQV